MRRERLSAAQAVFMIAPSASSGGKCLQAAMLAILGADRIAILPRQSILRPASLTLPEKSGPSELPAHIMCVENALRDYGKGPTLSASQVMRALQKSFGVGLSNYVHDHVAPSLERRNLIQIRGGKWLGLIPWRRYEVTAKGSMLARPLDRLMGAVDELPALIEADPDRALHLAREAGILLVMSPKARRQIPALRKLLASRGDGDVSVTSVAFFDDSESEWGSLMDLCEIALELDTEAFFDCVEAVGDFTSGSDGSSSDGGGDGGGGGD